jgi:hypothetical protein
MATNFNYLMTDFPNGNIDPKTLIVECFVATTESPSLTYDATNVEITFNDVVPLKVTIDAVVAAHQGYGNALEIAKSKKTDQIDAKTSRLISQGFQFPPATGQIFSLSPAGQNTLLGLNAAKDAPQLIYPVIYNTKDDEGTISLPDAATVYAFFLTAVGTYRYWLDSGTAIKDEIRDATTVAEVEAIVDPR